MGIWTSFKYFCLRSGLGATQKQNWRWLTRKRNNITFDEQICKIYLKMNMNCRTGHQMTKREIQSSRIKRNLLVNIIPWQSVPFYILIGTTLSIMMTPRQDLCLQFGAFSRKMPFGCCHFLPSPLNLLSWNKVLTGLMAFPLFSLRESAGIYTHSPRDSQS